jgi:hypothetical protein
VLLEPAFELLSLPALWKMVAKERERSPQFRPAQKPGEIVPALMSVWPIDAPAQVIGELPKRDRVAGVKFHLEARLLAVRGE